MSITLTQVKAHSSQGSVCAWCETGLERCCYTMQKAEPVAGIPSCAWLFSLLWGPAPQIPNKYTWRLIVSYKCPALAWLFSTTFLKLSCLPFASGLLSLSYMSFFTSFSVACCVDGWLAPVSFFLSFVASCSSLGVGGPSVCLLLLMVN